MPNPAMLEADIDYCWQLLESGRSVTRIADMTGRWRKTIRKYCRPRNPERWDLLCAPHTNGGVRPADDARQQAAAQRAVTAKAWLVIHDEIATKIMEESPWEIAVPRLRAEGYEGSDQTLKEWWKDSPVHDRAVHEHRRASGPHQRQPFIFKGLKTTIEEEEKAHRARMMTEKHYRDKSAFAPDELAELEAKLLVWVATSAGLRLYDDEPTA